MRLIHGTEPMNCDLPISEIEVAELIIDRCEDFSKKNVKDLINDIEFDDNSDGPGYLDIIISYKNEGIGYQVLFEKRHPHNQECFYEETLEISCPNSFN